MQKFNWYIALHLDKLQLGVKYIPSGRHASRNFHDHVFSELALVLHPNGAVHYAEGRGCALGRGDVILMHPGRIHGYANAGDLEIFNIVYEAEKLPLPRFDGGSMRLFNLLVMPQADVRSSPEKPLLRLPEETLARAEALAFELQKELEGDEPGKSLRAYAIFINLLTLICRAGGGLPHSKGYSGALAPALNYLNMHFREIPDLDALARGANMSRRGFFRHFRELTGMSPLQYRHDRCLSEARRLLLNTDMTLSEIAYECGFYDSNHLNRMFKTATGIPPGRFRRQAHPSAADLSRADSPLPEPY
ncbi:MAG: AraC family transcriptional regulator [Lentisphaeria bacterium]|nr:AraC family transcriptional regulator [Lentisphaeria bacterium]